MIIDADEYEEFIKHYGTPRHSGRYPYGSGDDPYQSAKTFLGMEKDLRKQGLSETEVARGMGLTSAQLRSIKSRANAEKKSGDIAMARGLKERGWSNVAIGKRMGVGESSIRDLLKDGEAEKANIIRNTADMLRDEVKRKPFLDVGKGNEHYMNVSREKLKSAVDILREEEGYVLFNNIKIDQLGTGKQTTLKILTPPGTTFGDVMKNKDNIKQIANYSDDGGHSYSGPYVPRGVASSRVGVRYAEQGGTAADGVIYVRRGVEDVSLGKSNYAQVRIKVDDTHYLKGMAMYHDDLPDGVDLLFNTNKSDTGNKLDSMKKIKGDDPTDPFGAMTKPIEKEGPDGKKYVSSVMNVVNAEGRWDDWSRNLSSQMLSKQAAHLAEEQLAITHDRKRRELEEINSVTNTAVKKRLLKSYSDDVDSSAVHLKAAALPRQSTKVILPINSMKETEVYAPTFKDGERVVLVRFPHGGKFEIPELRVNNRHPEAKKLLGNAPDAIGIHSKVAERLSGADFDGDTVLVIPNDHGKVQTAPPLEGLKNFDPKTAYPGYEGMAEMTTRQTGKEMGEISNLITDMHAKGATNSEIARAVRHSMVVIDAEKHKLNYKQSAINNNISDLKKKYQKKPDSDRYGGASTLISRASAEYRIPERTSRAAKDGGAIDKKTGKLMYTPTGNSYVKTTTSEKTGKVTEKTIIKTDKSTQLAETDDAHTLSSGSKIEQVYADHSNRLKALANEARREMVNTPNIVPSPSAKAVYRKEVERLNAALNLAQQNAPLERQAQIVANAIVKRKLESNPYMEDSEIKKLKAKALLEARTRTGAKKRLIEISDREWEAIQAGAITQHKLDQILSNTDLDAIKQRALPKEKKTVSKSDMARAKRLIANGHTQAEVADALGISVSTLGASLKEVNGG